MGNTTLNKTPNTNLKMIRFFRAFCITILIVSCILVSCTLFAGNLFTNADKEALISLTIMVIFTSTSLLLKITRTSILFLHSALLPITLLYLSIPVFKLALEQVELVVVGMNFNFLGWLGMLLCVHTAYMVCIYNVGEAVDLLICRTDRRPANRKIVVVKKKAKVIDC